MNAKLFKNGRYKLYIFPDDDFAKNAALSMCRGFGYQFYPKALEIGKNISTECFNGHLIKVESLKSDSVCTVSQSYYNSLDLPEVQPDFPDCRQALISRISKTKLENIKDSKLVFIAGRGIGNKSNYDRLKKLAESCGAGLGCSRPIAMNGWESYDNCVGISGNILEAEMIICFGVSGAIPFIKGIENCKTVIAVNKDKNAMIFKNADYAVVDDCMNLISYLEQNYK